MTARRHAFERARTFYGDKRGTWLAVDFEAWEREHTMITEFGWSAIYWDESANEVEEKGHLIVREYERYTNGTYVPEHRWVTGYFLSSCEI